jgi:hypothetical protein
MSKQHSYLILHQGKVINELIEAAGESQIEFYNQQFLFKYSSTK